MRRLHAATASTAVLILVSGLLGVLATTSAATPSAEPSASASTATPSAEPTASASTATPSAEPTASASSAVVERSGAGKKGAGKKGSTSSKPKPAPLNYTPAQGALMNNPLAGTEPRRRINAHLLRTIESVPGREKIRIASWNIRSGEITDALIRAHNRGVSVRLILDRLNANKEEPNPDINRLAAAFRKRETNRKPWMKSSVVRCVSACRAPKGIAHTKFFLFSKAGQAKDIVMYGSNNATDIAAHSQWNDVFTLVGKDNVHDEFNEIFNEMRRDKTAKQPFQTYQHGRFTSQFYPYRGKGADGDPLLAELNRITCKGPQGASSIRIAQTSMHGERGKKVAQRLAQMYQRGCDIKIVYAVFGNEVLRILRQTKRGAIPLRQIVQDFNSDGVYDKYLHMKNMAVRGYYNGKMRDVTWNGTANWTGVALVSDEIVMRIFGGGVRKQYAGWVDHLYANPPRTSGRSLLYRGANGFQPTEDMQGPPLGTLVNGIDPYANVQVN